MSKAMKGDKKVDETALKQIREACQYADKNRYQLSSEVLVDALAQLNETSSRLKETLDWRIKQGEGGAYVQRLKKDIASLQQRMVNIEQKIGVSVCEEVPVGTASSETSGVPSVAASGEV